MENWNPSPEYRKVAEANRQYYAKTAKMYETTETCVTDPRAQRVLNADLDCIVNLVEKSPSELQALDACGGSGNISIKLLKRGIDVTICDISPDLLDIFRQKCSEYGFAAKVVCAEIGEFLTKDEDRYDIVIFSSALHHLENIEDVLSVTFSRIKPGGVLFTVFDPTSRQSRFTRMITWLDYLVFKIFKQSTDLPASVMRRVRRTLTELVWQQGRGKDNMDLSDMNLGVLAEYHVEKGIDDIALVERLKQIGFEVVWHERYSDARHTWVRLLLNALGEVTAFKLLLRKAV